MIKYMRSSFLLITILFVIIIQTCSVLIDNIFIFNQSKDNFAHWTFFRIYQDDYRAHSYEPLQEYPGIPTNMEFDGLYLLGIGQVNFSISEKDISLKFDNGEKHWSISIPLPNEINVKNDYANHNGKDLICHITDYYYQVRGYSDTSPLYPKELLSYDLSKILANLAISCPFSNNNPLIGEKNFCEEITPCLDMIDEVISLNRVFYRLKLEDNAYQLNIDVKDSDSGDQIFYKIKNKIELTESNIPGLNIKISLINATFIMIIFSIGLALIMREQLFFLTKNINELNSYILDEPWFMLIVKSRIGKIVRNSWAMILVIMPFLYFTIIVFIFCYYSLSYLNLFLAIISIFALLIYGIIAINFIRCAKLIISSAAGQGRIF